MLKTEIEKQLQEFPLIGTEKQFTHTHTHIYTHIYIHIYITNDHFSCFLIVCCAIIVLH